MSALSALLPQPRHAPSPSTTKAPDFPSINDVRQAKIFQPPPYGKRQNFVPRAVEDFADGGAFPEIHVTQFPLNMGRKGGAPVSAGSGGGSGSGSSGSGATNGATASGETRVTPVQVDSEGNVQYDLIIRQNMNKNQVVQSQFTDLLEKDLTEAELARPSPEEEKKIADKTRAALGQIVDSKVALAQPTHVPKQNREVSYVRYTPSQAQDNDSMNSGAKQRLIRLQEMPVDPLEPPKFKHKKLPGGPPSPPVPVMHSPPRKLTVEDQQSWKIPPCISNWKNIKGYTIPLDKRLAADGRGLTETTVNHKFVHLSEALYKAEQIAREDIETRAKLNAEIARKQKKAQEEQLREIAARAREENMKKPERAEEAEDEEEIEARDERDQLRRERQREIRRDMRMENMKEENRKKANRERNEEERDVSEKIALGQAPQRSKDSMFDQRLFNQSHGMDQGFRGEESYDIYDKPLFQGSSANFMYKPKAVDDDVYGGDANVKSLLEKSTSKFKGDNEFKGAEAGNSGGRPREKPVEFEREKEDPFAIGEFYTDVRKKNPLDSIGKRGHMSAAGGSGHGQEFSRKHDSSRAVDFEESRGGSGGSGGGDSNKRHRK